MTSKYCYGILKAICMAGMLQLAAVGASAQSTETQKSLMVEADNSADATADTAAEGGMCTWERKFQWFFNADLGGSSVVNDASGNSTTANGLSWAASGNVSYRITDCTNTNLLLSAGLEVRNYNATATTTDRYGGQAYDNLHYWYAGVPIMLSLVNNPACCTNSNAFGYYAQAGVTVGARLHNSNYYSVQGENFNINLTEQYKPIIVQPVVSFGINYRCSGITYMAGPFATYAPSNILDNSKIKESIFSYGLRLTIHFNR
jgi:hypothetical protein